MTIAWVVMSLSGIPFAHSTQADRTPTTGGQVIRSPLRTLKGHTNVIFSVAFSHDGTMLATTSADGTAAIWDTTTWTQRFTFPSTIRAAAFSRDDKVLAADNGALVDTSTGQATSLHGNTGAFLAVAFSPDGATLAGACSDGSVRLWDTRTWKGKQVFHEKPGHITFIVFSPDGKTLAAGSPNSVVLWDIAVGLKKRVLKGMMDAVAAGAFSPDGRLFATGGCSNYTAQLWDTHTGRLRRSLQGHTNAITSVAFSPDGKRLATGSIDFHAKLWDVRTGRLLYTLVDHSERVYCLAFSPDGKLLATGDAYAKTKIWAVPR